MHSSIRLMGPAGESLVLTGEESASFESGDWIAEINAARRNVKVRSVHHGYETGAE